MERNGSKRYLVVLSEEERIVLLALAKGNASALKRRHALILLSTDEARPRGRRPDSEIASVQGIDRATPERVRKQCVVEGIEAAFERHKAPDGAARQWTKRGDPLRLPSAGAAWPCRLAGTAQRTRDRLADRPGHGDDLTARCMGAPHGCLDQCTKPVFGWIPEGAKA